MTTPPTLTEFEEKLARSLREAPAEPTPACCPEETLWDFAEQGGKHSDALNLIHHISSCAYCTQGYFAMKETLQLRRELAPAPLRSPAASSEETGHEVAPPVGELRRSWWERLHTLVQAPRTRLRLQLGGLALAVVAAMLLLLLLPRSDAKMTAKLQQSEQTIHTLQEELARQSRQDQAALQAAQSKVVQEQEAHRATQILLTRAQEKSNRLKATMSSRPTLPAGFLVEPKSAEQIVADSKGNMFDVTRIDPKESRPLRTRNLDFPKQQLASLAKVGGKTMGAPGEEPILLLRPSGTFVSSLRPTFAWKAVAQASEYKLTCFPQNKKENADSPPYTVPADVKQSKSEIVWQIPTDQLPLKASTTYTWTVQALDAQGQLIASSSKHEELFFRTLTASEIDEVERKRRRYATNPLLMGVLYGRLGVLEEAAQAFAMCLETDPDNKMARTMQKQVKAQQTTPP